MMRRELFLLAEERIFLSNLIVDFIHDALKRQKQKISLFCNVFLLLKKIWFMIHDRFNDVYYNPNLTLLMQDENSYNIRLIFFFL